MRMLVQFGKKDRLRFISHLDLQRFFQRALTRSGLPIAYSQGFNPHAVISFASALALGWTSEYEVLDVKLSAPIGRGHAEEAIKSALPQDLPVISVKLCDDKKPAPMSCVCAAEYLIKNSEISQEQIDEFLKSDTVMAVRKTKSGEREINIRPLVFDISKRNDGMFTRLSLTETDTLKPDLLVSALSGNTETMRIHRLTLLGKTGENSFMPLMDLLTKTGAN